MANVRWKDKADITTLASDDTIPVTDTSDSNTDKHTTPAEIKTYVWNGDVSLSGKLTGGSYEIEGSNFDINGGTIDGATLGGDSAILEINVDNLKIDGNTLSSTNTNGDINITPDGTGEVNISKADIDGGTIDGVSIGSTSAISYLAVDSLILNGSNIGITTDTDLLELENENVVLTGDLEFSGDRDIKVEQATSGDGNDLDIKAGKGATGGAATDGGDLNLEGGNGSENGTGGDVTINGGEGDGTGDDGNVVIAGSRGNAIIGKGNAGASAEGVLVLGNAVTVPTAAGTDSSMIFGEDTSDSKSSLSMRLEQNVETDTPTADRKLKIKINGTEYYLLLKTV